MQQKQTDFYGQSSIILTFSYKIVNVKILTAGFNKILDSIQFRFDPIIQFNPGNRPAKISGACVAIRIRHHKNQIKLN